MGSDGRVSKDGRVINVESGEGKAVLIKNDISRHFNGLVLRLYTMYPFLWDLNPKTHKVRL